MDNSTALSDQAIVSGILIGGTSESKAMIAIYDQFAYTLQSFVDVSQTPIDTSIVWQTIECFSNGIKGGQIMLKSSDKSIEFYLKEISKIIKTQEASSFDNINAVYEDKLVWDYYLSILRNVEGEKNRLLTRSFGEEITVNDLADRLIAKGRYVSKDELKTEKYSLIQQILEQL